MEAFLLGVGLNPADLFAAFCGAVAASVTITDPQPFKILSAIIAGTLVGAYLGPIAPSYFPLYFGDKTGKSVTFIVGLLGIPICRKIYAKFLQYKGDNGA